MTGHVSPPRTGTAEGSLAAEAPPPPPKDFPSEVIVQEGRKTAGSVVANDVIEGMKARASSEGQESDRNTSREEEDTKRGAQVEVSSIVRRALGVMGRSNTSEVEDEGRFLAPQKRGEVKDLTFNIRGDSNILFWRGCL